MEPGQVEATDTIAFTRVGRSQGPYCSISSRFLRLTLHRYGRGRCSTPESGVMDLRTSCRLEEEEERRSYASAQQRKSRAVGLALVVP
jgi:hypothetical protein